MVSKNICSRRFLNFEVHFVSSVLRLNRNLEPFLHNILSLPYIYIIARILRFVNKFYSIGRNYLSVNKVVQGQAINHSPCGEKLMMRNRAYTLICREILLRTAHFPARFMTNYLVLYIHKCTLMWCGQNCGQITSNFT